MQDAEGAGSLLPDAEFLARLLRRLGETDIDELEIEWGDLRLSVRRDPDHQLLSEWRGGPVEGPVGVPVGAPLTGVFYSRPSPEQPPFVVPGDLVEPGQTVGLIETMKLFNEVAVEMAGEVVSIAAQDGDLVESGQPLLYVRPAAEGEIE